MVSSNRGKVLEPADFVQSEISYEMAVAAARVVAERASCVEDARVLMDMLGVLPVLVRERS